MKIVIKFIKSLFINIYLTVQYIFYSTLLNIYDFFYLVVHKPVLLPYKIIQLVTETIYDLWVLPASLFSSHPLSSALTYGSTPVSTTLKILQQISTNKHTRLIDLGCGRGNVIFSTSIGLKLNTIGIEINPAHFRFAKFIKSIFFKSPARIIQEDILKTEINDADIIFLSNTCFPKFMEILLTKKLDNLKINTIIISLSAPILSDKYKVESKAEYLFSWGKGTVYIQRKVKH